MKNISLYLALVGLALTSAFAQNENDVTSKVWGNKISSGNTLSKTAPRSSPLSPLDGTDVRAHPTTNTTQSEMSIAVHPMDKNTVLASANTSNYPATVFYGTGAYWSTDHGQTWSGFDQPPSGNANGGDPAAAIDELGNFYIGSIAPNWGQGVMRSTNGGSSWTYFQIANPTITDPDHLLDKNHLAVDNSPTSQFHGTLYSAWTDFGQAFPNWPVRIARSQSTNHGTSWEPPQTISFNTWSQGVNIQTGPTGQVYATWAHPQGASPYTERSLGFNRSFDGGATWGTPTVPIDIIYGIRTPNTGPYFQPYNIRTNSFPSMAVSQISGDIYIVWTNVGVPGVNIGDPDIYLIKSTNGGANWGSPIRVNNDQSGNGANQWFPWIAVDPVTDEVSVVFYDGRNHIGTTTAEVFVGKSTNGGTSFENFVVSDEGFTVGSLGGIFSTGYNGDYIGIAARDGNIYPIWNAQVPSANSQGWVSPIIQFVSVTVDQRRELNQQLTNSQIGRWEGGLDFVSSTVPIPPFDFAVGSREVLRGYQQLVTSPSEKYRVWERNQVAQLDTVQNHRGFTITPFDNNLTSRFNPTDPTITIKTDLIDAPGTTGGNIQFRDPWYIDYPDPNYGNNLRNRGMTDAIYHDRGSPFYPDFNTPPGEQSYRGVFLNQNPQFDPLLPNYSVGAPQPITIAGFASYFQKWVGTNVQYQNPSLAQTGVVFTNAGATATASYKAHFGSSSANATSPSSQRKIIRDKNGHFHAVHESANHVWYSRSTNGGTTWSPEVKVSTDVEVEPPLGMTHRNPSLTWQSHPLERVLIVWETQRYEEEWSQNYVSANTINPLTMQLDTEFQVADIGTFPGIDFSTMPSASNSYSSGGANNILVVWYDATQPAIMGSVKGSTGSWSGETFLQEGTYHCAYNGAERRFRELGAMADRVGGIKHIILWNNTGQRGPGV